MKNKKTFLLLLLVPIIIFFIGRSFSLPHLEEVRSVEIQSDGYATNTPGSWHIDKSAEWTGFGKARVTFDVNSILKTVEGRYKDVILVIDISGSMAGEKLDRAKADAIDLTNYLLSDNHNSISLITFESASTIVSSFINDKDTMLSYLNDLSSTGCTNYNAGLLNVAEVMESYTRDPNKDLIVLFLTDGYPNEDTPNEVATYHMLKDKYPYMTINGVQYEMGIDIIQEIVDISDNQWVADRDTLHNVLFDATLSPLMYDNFVITDYINNDYFYANSVSDIKVDRGEATLTEEAGVQKVIWNLGDTYKTGDSIKMTIDLNLKEEYHNTKGYYPTNKSETIDYKLQGDEEKNVDSTLTPVLKNVYNVIYDTNTPNGCNLPSIDNEEHYVYQSVIKKSPDSLSCNGYLFKGLEIDDNDKKDITIINDDMFVMPNHDVHIKVIWTKQDLVKKMDGKVREKVTLYDVLQNEANIGTYAKKYTGAHQDSMDNSGTSDIYYYYASNETNAETIIKEKNNVIFANHCWQMYRTTDTGGVKLIYNGEVENDKCLKTRGNHVGYYYYLGYESRIAQDLSGTYYYGTDYIYENGTFKLSGIVTPKEITNVNVLNTITTLVGKYTCRGITSDSTCSTLYLIEEYSNGTSAFVIPLNSNSHYSQYGNLHFNVLYNSLADVGYMYNQRYAYDSKTMTNVELVLNAKNLNTTYWYSTSIRWGNPVADNYNLVNAYRIGTINNTYLKGKYTFANSTKTYTDTSVDYIVSVDNNRNMYYIQLTNTGNHALSDFNYTYTYGNSYRDNGDGTYTINNPTTIKRSDWYLKYINVGANKYLCKNAINNTCNELWYTTSTNKTSITYIKVANEYKYATDFEYKQDPSDGIYKYFLNDANAITFWNINDSTNKTSLNTHHYTCFNASGVCEQISYIYSLNDTNPNYITLTDGKNVEVAIKEMLYFDNSNYHVNNKNSTIKFGIDAWYMKYILNDFDEYVEDTVYCNDRLIKTLGTWESSGNLSSIMTFAQYNITEDLSCTNDTDKFSTQNSKAQLTYKVGLATNPEMNLLGNNYLTKTGQMYWLITPLEFNGYPIVRHVESNGFAGNGSHAGPVSTAYGLRPVISLIPNIEYIDGDGSMENPYLIDDGTH